MIKQKELKVEDIKRLAENKSCPVQKSLYYIDEFLAGPMCGRCFPCAFGCYEARIRLQKIVDCTCTEADISAVRKIAQEMIFSSLCAKGKNTAKFILEWMSTGIFDEHIAKSCPTNECRACIQYIIVPEKCNMCGHCQEVCKYDAILGEKRMPFLSGYLPFEIRQKRCTKCGECITVCPTNAIITVTTKGV